MPNRGVLKDQGALEQHPAVMLSEQGFLHLIGRERVTNGERY